MYVLCLCLVCTGVGIRVCDSLCAYVFVCTCVLIYVSIP